MERLSGRLPAAKAAGEPLGLTVLLGLELRLDGAEKTGEPALDALRDSINEYLVYGVTEEQLRRYPALYTLDEKRLKALAEQLGWFVAQSHPCRSGMSPARRLPGRGGGHERQPPPQLPQRRRRLLLPANGLVGLSGSDFHEWEDLAIGGLDFAGRCPTAPRWSPGCGRANSCGFVRKRRCLTKERGGFVRKYWKERGKMRGKPPETKFSIDKPR